MVKGDGDMTKLRNQQQIAEPMAQLREQVESAADEYITLVLGHKATKDTEMAEFKGALDHAKAEAAAESKAEIAAYNALAKRSLTEASDQPYAVIQNPRLHLLTSSSSTSRPPVLTSPSPPPTLPLLASPATPSSKTCTRPTRRSMRS